MASCMLFVSMRPTLIPRRNGLMVQETDDRVVQELQAAGLRVVTHNALLLREPQEVVLDMARWAGHFGTLMPFSRSGLCGFPGVASGANSLDY